MTSLAAAWSKTSKKKEKKSLNLENNKKLKNIQISKTLSKLSELHRMCP